MNKMDLSKTALKSFLMAFALLASMGVATKASAKRHVIPKMAVERDDGEAQLRLCAGSLADMADHKVRMICTSKGWMTDREYEKSVVTQHTTESSESLALAADLNELDEIGEIEKSAPMWSESFDENVTLHATVDP